MWGKKGDIELQFNWIFVFIVGTLILAIAAGFVINQKKNSDILISGQIIRFVRSVLTISSATPGKAEPQPLQKEIGVSCDSGGCSDQGCASDFYVKPRTLNAKIDTKIETIFSPTSIKGQTLGTWSMEWDMPYHINNFLYTTSDQVRYVFVAGADPVYNDLLDELYSEMPDIMGQKERVTKLENIKDHNNYKVRLVFVAPEDQSPEMPSALSNMGSKDLSAIQIIPDEALINLPGEESRFSIGAIKFYQKSGSGFTPVSKSGESEVYFLGKPTVFGAIFSEDRNMYECNMHKALLRQMVVSELYSLKLETLRASNEITNPACLNLYDTAKADIQAFSEPEQLTLEDAPAIIEKSGKIAAANNALKLKSCPLIY